MWAISRLLNFIPVPSKFFLLFKKTKSRFILVWNFNKEIKRSFPWTCYQLQFLKQIVLRRTVIRQTKIVVKFVIFRPTKTFNIFYIWIKRLFSEIEEISLCDFWEIKTRGITFFINIKLFTQNLLSERSQSHRFWQVSKE